MPFFRALFPWFLQTWPHARNVRLNYLIQQTGDTVTHLLIALTVDPGSPLFERCRTTVNLHPWQAFLCVLNAARSIRILVNRRFHAEPIACQTCGPELTYYQDDHPDLKREEALQAARTLIQSGGILALKGLGGYQLVCDASNPETITRLRKGKLRSDKPFALMAYDALTIRKYCNLLAEDENILLSPQHPIVILPAKPSSLQHNAPRQNTLGFMLPYTPLHFLITEPATTYPEVLVMTSGNISDEPMFIEDKAAINHLNHIADGFLGHNRPILNRVDDSSVSI